MSQQPNTMPVQPVAFTQPGNALPPVSAAPPANMAMPAAPSSNPVPATLPVQTIPQGTIYSPYPASLSPAGYSTGNNAFPQASPNPLSMSIPPIPSPMEVMMPQRSIYSYPQATPVLGNPNPLYQPLPEIPPPHVVAPAVFGLPPNLMNAAPPVQSAPASANPAETKKPDETKKPEETDAEKKAKADEQAKNEPPKNKVDHASTLTEEKVNRLNKGLNDSSPNLRATSAMEFYKLLSVNPDLINNPQYRPYVEAFIIKILSDPSPIVRQAIMLAYETGVLEDGPEKAIPILEELTRQDSLEGQEASGAKLAIEKIKAAHAAKAAPDHAAPAETPSPEQIASTSAPVAGGGH